MRIEPGSGPSVAACKWTQRGEGGIQRTKPYSYIFASVCARGARLPFFFWGGGNLFAGWFGWTLFPRVCAQGIDKLCECYLSYGRDSLCSHCALLRLVVSLGRVCIREREKRPRRPPPPLSFRSATVSLDVCVRARLCFWRDLLLILVVAACGQLSRSGAAGPTIAAYNVVYIYMCTRLGRERERERGSYKENWGGEKALWSRPPFIR